MRQDVMRQQVPEFFCLIQTYISLYSAIDQKRISFVIETYFRVSSILLPRGR